MTSEASPFVSVPTVVGAAVAAATAAALGTRLGLVGTVLGAAAMSVVSTVVAGGISGWLERLHGVVRRREPARWQPYLVGAIAVTLVAVAFHAGWSMLTGDLPAGSFAARVLARLSL